MQGSRRRTGVMLLLLSLALNSFFIGQNLPQVSHPDEPKVVRRAMAMGGGDLNPHFFRYPTLWIYLVFLAQGTAAAAGLGLGLIGGLAQLQRMVFTDPTLFFVVPRLLAALLGAGSVWLTWRIGERLAPGAGVIAGLLVALNGHQIWQSHYATADGPLVFFILLCLWACFRCLDRPSLRSVAIPALLAGFATSVKYNGVAVFGAVAVLVWVVGRARHRSAGARGKGLALALVVALAGFLVTSPFTLLDYHAFRVGLGEVMDYTVRVAGGDARWTYLRGLVDSAGLPAVLGGLLGGGILLLSPSFRPHRGKAAILAGFLVPYGILLQSSDVKAVRFMLPVVPVLALGVALAFRQILIWIGPARRTLTWTAGGTLFALFLGPSLLAAKGTEAFFLHPTARTRTARWVESRLPEGSTIFLDNSAGLELLPHRDVVESRLRDWKASRRPRAVALVKAYTSYLETGAAEHGFRLAPSDSVFLFTFSSGWAPGLDYRLSRLEGIRYVIVGTDSMTSAGNQDRARFFREVADRFRVIHEEPERETRGVVADEAVPKGGPYLVLERKPGSER